MRHPARAWRVHLQAAGGVLLAAAMAVVAEGISREALGIGMQAAFIGLASVGLHWMGSSDAHAFLKRPRLRSDRLDRWSAANAMFSGTLGVCLMALGYSIWFALFMTRHDVPAA